MNVQPFTESAASSQKRIVPDYEHKETLPNKRAHLIIPSRKRGLEIKQKQPTKRYCPQNTHGPYDEIDHLGQRRFGTTNASDHMPYVS